MTEEDKVRLIKVKLQKYHNSFNDLEMTREDLIRYKNELLKSITDLTMYEEKKKLISKNITAASLVSMVVCLGIGYLCERFNINKDDVNQLIYNPRFYGVVTIALFLPFTFSHKIAEVIVAKKYGKEIAIKEAINRDKMDDIEVINYNLNVVESDFNRTSLEIGRLESAIQVLKKVEDENFLNIEPPRIRQLID